MTRKKVSDEIEKQEALLCRDEEGNIKIFKRKIKIKSGPVIVGEHGYYCTKCRKRLPA